MSVNWFEVIWLVNVLFRSNLAGKCSCNKLYDEGALVSYAIWLVNIGESGHMVCKHLCEL